MSQPSYFQPVVKSPANSESLESAAPLPWWVSAIVIIGALLMILGAVIALVNPALLIAPLEPITPGVRVYAGYLVSRNLAIGVMLLSALSIRARSALLTLMVLTALIQLLDALLDCFEGRWALVPVVGILGIAFLTGAVRVAGQPLREIASRRNPRR